MIGNYVSYLKKQYNCELLDKCRRYYHGPKTTIVFIAFLYIFFAYLQDASCEMIPSLTM